MVEAIYENGVLRLVEHLDLDEHERVELVVRATGNGSALPAAAQTKAGRQAAVRVFLDEVDRMNLRLRIRMPAREALHPRG